MLAERPNELNVRSNPAATWSFVLGIAGIFLAAVVVGGLFGAAAVLLGIKARRGYSRKSWALGGVICGTVALAGSVWALTVWTSAWHAGEALHGAAAVQTTRATINNVTQALKTFELDTGHFPTTEEGMQSLLQSPPGVTGWRGPYLERFPADAWGRPLVYACPGAEEPTGFDLFSSGTDGVEGTPDDIPPRKNTQN